MRALIAAQACMLIVARPSLWYDDLATIHVYPGAYAGKNVAVDGHIVSERTSHRLGESWMRGPVVLSWRDTIEGAADARDGRNLVYHEFAHRLDAQTGVVDGAPLVGSTTGATRWANAMRPRFEAHRRQVSEGAPTFFDAYGATSPAEFFAVAVEAFFERGGELRELDPDLYDLFRDYFVLSPHEW